MKTSLLIVSCLVWFSTLLIRTTTAEVIPLASNGHATGASSLDPHACGGEPCDAVVRGFRAFFDRKLDGLGANGRACADCHMPTDSFQLSPASVEVRFQFLQWRRRLNPDADDPLFRPIDADDFRTNGDNASDFSNLRQNGLVRITFPLPPNIRLIDPATNQPSSETEVDVWRAVPTVNDVALTGPDDGILWPRGPNERGGYQLDARFGTLQEQALAALTNHAQIQSAPPQQLLDDLSSFQRVLFTNERVRALSDAVRQGALPLPDPDRRLNALEQQGKAVFERACAQCHGGPGQSTPQATPNNPPAPVIRFHSIASQCPRPVDPGGRFVFAQCSPQLARNARTYAIALSIDTSTTDRGPSSRDHRPPDVVRSRPRAADRVRWRCWTEGRLGEVRCARTSRPQQDGTLLPQQQRRHARGDARSL